MLVQCSDCGSSFPVARDTVIFRCPDCNAFISIQDQVDTHKRIKKISTDDIGFHKKRKWEGK